MKKNVAVVLAAGTGTRLQSDLPKQFLMLNGQPVLLYAVKAFQQHEAIDEILIVSHPHYIDMVKDMTKDKFSKLSAIIPGGKMRYHSTLAAIHHFYDRENENILLHDAARPLITHEIIDRVVNALGTHKAVTVAIPATDTLYEIGDNGVIVNIPNRSACYNAQTPQAFDITLIKKAYELGMLDKNFNPTDDCSVVKNYLPEEPIVVVEGSLQNKKITYLADVKDVEIMLIKN